MSIDLKNFLKNFRIPKTVIGLLLLAAGAYLKNETLITIGLSLLGVGVASKAIKTAQGDDPFRHERQFKAIAEMFSNRNRKEL